MDNQPGSKIRLENSRCVLEMDACGGAITKFSLTDEALNPLNFQLPADGISSDCGQATFKGHFLCLGRWGDPSPGEKAAGAVKHGDFFTRIWNGAPKNDRRAACMEVASPVEGLHISREVVLDDKSAAYVVRESVTNINKYGRYYNMVQHPTIAAPFLNDATRVFSNANIGICQSVANQDRYSKWPLGLPDDGRAVDLSTSCQPDNNVFSFIVEPGAALGWLAVYSPADKLLIGYAWPRADFPWINFWQHSEDGRMRYRGLEFGTSGIHAPLYDIVATNRSVMLGEKTVRFIEPGERSDTSYISFLVKTADVISVVRDISIVEKDLLVHYNGGCIKIGLPVMLRM